MRAVVGCLVSNSPQAVSCLVAGSLASWPLWFQVKDLARFKPMQRHLFLYDKMLLFCKKRDETTEGHEKSPSYSFKHSLKVGHRSSGMLSDHGGQSWTL